jgi:hypothetical protein
MEAIRKGRRTTAVISRAKPESFGFAFESMIVNPFSDLRFQISDPRSPIPDLRSQISDLRFEI